MAEKQAGTNTGCTGEVFRSNSEDGGLGYREVCQFLNDKCGMDIGIPDIEEGYYQKRAQAYEEKNGGDGR